MRINAAPPPIDRIRLGGRTCFKERQGSSHLVTDRKRGA